MFLILLFILNFITFYYNIIFTINILLLFGKSKLRIEPNAQSKACKNTFFSNTISTAHNFFSPPPSETVTSDSTTNPLYSYCVFLECATRRNP